MIRFSDVADGGVQTLEANDPSNLNVVEEVDRFVNNCFKTLYHEVRNSRHSRHSRPDHTKGSQELDTSIKLHHPNNNPCSSVLVSFSTMFDQHHSITLEFLIRLCCQR